MKYAAWSVLAVAVVGIGAVWGQGASMGTAMPAQAAMRLPQTEMEKKGIDFLVSQQGVNGAWLPEVGPAVTGMVVRALVQGGKSMDDPAVVKGLAYIESCKQGDGGYYKDSNPNYNSAVILGMYAALPDPQGIYQGRIKGLQAFLKSLQMDEQKDITADGTKTVPHVTGGNQIVKDNAWYGGSGYGEDRPDLSNTAFFMEALHDSGVPASDPAMQKALVFVSRSQMNSETNSMAFAKGATDGGFIYTPVYGGESKFGDIDKLDGSSQLRSYGSMTYSGFKSMLYAGLTQDDPRVKAAVKWIQTNWSLDYNPGSASYDGQYYYIHTFAKAMRAWGQDVITDSKGVKHDWRAELNAKLEGTQKADGSWSNEKSERWFEHEPKLVTSYCVLSLEEARK